MSDKQVLHRLYFKYVGAGILGVALCVLASSMSHVWRNLLFIPVIVLAITASIVQLNINMKKGNIVAIQAECMGEANSETFRDKFTTTRTYRFLVDDSEDAAGSIYIRIDRNKFRAGERYCLLFRKDPEGKYTERNLLTYGVINPDVGKPVTLEEDAPSNVVTFEDAVRRREEENQ